MFHYERRETTDEDIRVMLENIREFSRNELMIVAGTEETALKQACEGSRDVWSGYVNDELALIYGVKVISILNNHAYIWMLTTKVVERHWVTFIRVSALYTWQLLQQYDQISAIAPMKSSLSQKWLKYVGFTQVGVTRLYGIKFKSYMITKGTVEDKKLQWLKGDEKWPPLLAS